MLHKDNCKPIREAFEFWIWCDLYYRFYGKCPLDPTTTPGEVGVMLSHLYLPLVVETQVSKTYSHSKHQLCNRETPYI